MDITGLTLEQFCAVTNYVSVTSYGGNVIVSSDAHDRTASKDGTPHCTARLAVLNSRGPGSRTSWTGRHGPYACWHAYRDVLEKVFTRYPNAVIRAGNSWRVTYRGMDGFRATYPETANRNVGSRVEPVTMPELCDCPPSASEFPRGTPAYMPDEPVFIHRTRPETVAVPGYTGVRTVITHTYRTRETAGTPGVILPEEHDPYDNPDYVSPAVARASRVLAASAELLDDKPADPYVFGPPGGPTQYIASPYLGDDDED